MSPDYPLNINDFPSSESTPAKPVVPLHSFDPDTYARSHDLTAFSRITLTARNGSTVHAQEVADRLRLIAPTVPVVVEVVDMPGFNAERGVDDHGTLAQVFYGQHAGEVRWLADMEHWLCWQDGKWQGVTDRSGHQLVRGRLLVTLYTHARLGQRKVFSAVKKATGDEAKAFMAARKYEEGVRSAATQRAVWDVVGAMAAFSSVTTTLDQLNPDPWLLNAPNGIVDLRTGTLMPHDPRRLCTESTGVAYDPTATAPVFERFLAEALPDPQVRAFVQRRAGSFLIGEQREHVLHVDLGESGRNGKTTLDDATRMAMGSYAVVTDARILLVSSTDRHETEKARLVHKRLVLVEEARSTRMLDVATCKHLTGGARRSARFMRQDAFEYAPSDSWLLVTNEMPKFKGSDAALGARLMIVPWEVSFAGREDVELPAKIRSEAQGVLAWMVAGAVEYAKVGLDPPEVVRTATETERREHDPVSEWLDEHVSEGPGTGEFAHIGQMYAHCSELFKERRIIDDLPSYIEFGRQVSRWMKKTGWSVVSKQRTLPGYGKTVAWVGAVYTPPSWTLDTSWLSSLTT